MPLKRKSYSDHATTAADTTTTTRKSRKYVPDHAVAERADDDDSMDTDLYSAVRMKVVVVCKIVVVSPVVLWNHYAVTHLFHMFLDIYTKKDNLPWRRFLHSTVSLADIDVHSWENVLANQKFALTDDKLDDAKKFFSFLDATTTTLEEYLLPVYCLSNTPPMKSKFYWYLFKNGEETGRMIPAYTIFHDLPTRCLQILERRISQNQSINGTSAMYLLSCILSLIANCDAINNAKIVLTMKKKTNVDWQRCLSEVKYWMLCCVCIFRPFIPDSFSHTIFLHLPGTCIYW
jgi:hypothetical protein